MDSSRVPSVSPEAYARGFLIQHTRCSTSTPTAKLSDPAPPTSDTTPARPNAS
jgi:hypothetical protein